MQENKFFLGTKELPKSWYNILPDLPRPLDPPLKLRAPAVGIGWSEYLPRTLWRTRKKPLQVRRQPDRLLPHASRARLIDQFQRRSEGSHRQHRGAAQLPAGRVVPGCEVRL